MIMDLNLNWNLPKVDISMARPAHTAISGREAFAEARGERPGGGWAGMVGDERQ